MVYTFNPTPSGTVEILQDGQRVSTGTASYASQFGYVAPLPKETALIGTPSARENFQTNVQPSIDDANKAVADAKVFLERLKTEGVTDKAEPDVPPEITDEGKSEADLYQAKLQTNLDTQKKAAEDQAAQLTLAQKSSAQAQINSLTAQWNERRALLQQSNRANLGTWQQQFLRSGQAEYAPGISGDFLSAKEKEGLAKVQELDNQYNSTLAEINSALNNNLYSIAAEKTNALNALEEKVLEAMNKNAEEAQRVKDVVTEENRKITLSDTAYNLIASGVNTEDELYYELRNRGLSVTPEEVSDVLKFLQPKPSSGGLFKFDTKSTISLVQGGLTGDEVQQFQNDINKYGIDKALQGLPEAVRPEIERIVLSMQAPNSIGGTLTISEAKSLGLPISLIGRSQDQVITDLQSSIPPQWFVEYLETERQQNLVPEVVQSEWQKFRTNLVQSIPTSTQSTFDFSGLPPPIQ